MNFIKIISFSLILVLGACGGDKVITTTDDSADYQSARQLPPLNKTSGIDSAEQELGVNRSADAASEAINASLVDGANNTVRVRIDTEINIAWPYFLAKLRTSGVTIHSRNNADHRVEVGCGTMDDGMTNARNLSWSIFNRGNLVSEYCVMALSGNKDNTLVSVLNRQGQEVLGSEATKLLNKIVSQ